MNPWTREDLEKIKNDDDRAKALLEAGVQFTDSLTAGAIKTSPYKRETIARRMGVDPSNFSKWKPAFSDELPTERPKADQVVAIAYGSESDEPAKWLANFCGGIFVKLRPFKEIRVNDLSALADTLRAQSEVVRIFSEIIRDRKIDARDQDLVKDFWEAVSTQSEMSFGLAVYLRDVVAEAVAG